MPVCFVLWLHNLFPALVKNHCTATKDFRPHKLVSEMWVSLLLEITDASMNANPLIIMISPMKYTNPKIVRLWWNTIKKPIVMQQYSRLAAAITLKNGRHFPSTRK
jgi:hypothetical protein